MQLSRITLQGFRCFGSEPTIVDISPLTAFVGTNGAGKTAVLMALVRMFGITSAQRNLMKEDFHVAVGNEAADERTLRIEARFDFPELMDEEEGSRSAAVPECLRHILVTGTAVPFCRVQLVATWRKSAAVEGDIEAKLSWINSAEEVPPEEAIISLQSIERSLIQVFYVPATRDAVRELKAVGGTILTRALRRIAWSDGVRETVRDHADELTGAVRSEPAVAALETELKRHWADLHGGAAGPSFRFGESEIDNVLRGLDVRLEGASAITQSIELLSEGERSLLYFALVEATLAFEASLAAGGEEETGSATPALTILAIEEPENHLAPQYLGRILKSLREIGNVGTAQAILTSHSASIMRRIEPEEVRHLRINAAGERKVSRLVLPSDADASFKYVREAVRSHPELYFASVVILCEGASEEVVLPRMARALGLDVDPRFVAVVPLGGRHVHHFWSMLRQLSIPYVTVLDLDTERALGGWHRMHGTMQELIDLGEAEALVHPGMTAAQFAALPQETNLTGLSAAIVNLETNFDVFFSEPLDLDLLMLAEFPGQYHAVAPPRGGPNIPTEAVAKAARIVAATKSVLGTGNGSSYTQAVREMFPWHSYLFGQMSKPAVHARALSAIDDVNLAASCPAMIRRLVERVKVLVTP